MPSDHERPFTVGKSPEHERTLAAVDEMQIRITRLIDGFETRQHERHLAIMRRVTEAETLATSNAAFIKDTLNSLVYIVARVERVMIATKLEAERQRDIDSQAQLPLDQRRGVKMEWPVHFDTDALEAEVKAAAAELDALEPPLPDIPPPAPSTPSVCLQCGEALSGSCNVVEMAGGVGHIHAGCAEAWGQNEDNPKHPDFVPF